MSCAAAIDSTEDTRPAAPWRSARCTALRRWSTADSDSSGVEGHVFRDLDGDGKFGDAATSPSPERRCASVACSRAPTRAADTRCGTCCRIEAVNVRSTRSRWRIRRGCRRCRRARCVRRRSSTRGIEFALVRTREIAGVLVPGARSPTPAGVGLELRDVASGAMHTARTFSDGAFYFSRVRPGTLSPHARDARPPRRSASRRHLRWTSSIDADRSDDRGPAGDHSATRRDRRRALIEVRCPRPRDTRGAAERRAAARASAGRIELDAIRRRRATRDPSQSCGARRTGSMRTGTKPSAELEARVMTSCGRAGRRRDRWREASPSRPDPCGSP